MTLGCDPVQSVRRKESQAHATGGISDSERLRRDLLRDNGTRRDYRPRANAYSGSDYGCMRNPDVVTDYERTARAFAPVREAYHRGDHATGSDGHRLISLYGCPVIEAGPVAYPELGSWVADEFGGDHASAKAQPVSQLNSSVIFDADGTEGSDPPSALTVSKHDCAADDSRSAVQCAAGVFLQALEKATHEVRVRIRGGSGCLLMACCRRGRRRATANHRATLDYAAATDACAGQDDSAVFESDASLYDDRNRLGRLQAFAELVKVVVQDLAPCPDPASVGNLNGLERLNRGAALDLDIVAEDHFGSEADIEFDRSAGGVEADTVSDPERPFTVHPDPAHNRRRRTQLGAAAELQAGNKCC